MFLGGEPASTSPEHALNTSCPAAMELARILRATNPRAFLAERRASVANEWWTREAHRNPLITDANAQGGRR
jgi:hypothetical protein